jgi:DNA-directed RNA polymerase subunit delta
MKIKDMKKEELEVLSYTDLTELILKENKKAMNTPSIFKKICELLELTEEEYTNQIGDYYTSLTTDKRFILLDTAEWDLKDKHKVEIVLEEDEEDEDVSFEDEEEVEEDTESEELDESVEITDDDIDLDDGIEDLNIITDEELEEEM